MLPEIWSSAALWLSQLRQQRVGVGDQARRPGRCARPARWSTLLALASRLAQLRVALVERLGEPCHALDRDLQIRRGVGEGLRQHPQRVGQLIGVQPADRRCADRPAHRAVDRATWCGRAGIGPDSWPSPRGVTSRILVPSRLLVLIAASVRSPSRMFLSTLNLTSTRGPSSSTRCTCTDLEARNLHARHRSSDRRPRRSRRSSSLPACEERQLVVVQRDQHDGRRSTPTPMAPMTSGLRSEKDFISARTVPVAWPATLT